MGIFCCVTVGLQMIIEAHSVMHPNAPSKKTWMFKDVTFWTDVHFVHITDALFQNVWDWWKLHSKALWPPLFQGQGDISLSEDINNKL